MANLFRLVLLCMPLFGAVAATAEVQRIDRGSAAEEVSEVSEVTNYAKTEIVLALNTAAPALRVTDGSDVLIADQLIVTPDVVNRASAGLPICLALVFLVTLIRKRVQ